MAGRGLCMRTIGIKLADGSFYPIMEEGAAQKKTLELTTAHNNQTCVMVDLYRSKNCTMDDAEYIDTLKIENLIGHPNGEPSIAFDVDLDENGELSASIADPETGASSDSKITLVSRTIEERLQADDYSIGESSDTDTDNSAAVAAGAGAALAGAGLLAAAAAMAKEKEDETVEVEDGFENEPAFTEDLNFTEEPIISEYSNITDEPVVSEEPVVEEEPVVGEEPVVEEEPLVADEPVIEDELFTGDDTVIEEGPAASDQTVIEDDPFASDDTVIEEEPFASDDTVIEEEAVSADQTIIEDDPFASDDTVIEEEPAITDDTLVEDNTSLSDDNLLADMPDFDENNGFTAEDTNLEEDNFSNFDLPDSDTASGGLNFSGLYDKETEMGNPSENQEDDYKKKTRPAVIICIICAIICLVATALVLLVLPTKFNLRLKHAQKAKAESAIEKTVEVKTEEAPKAPEKVPEAKVDEVVVIEKAEEVKPLPPPAAETKSEGVTYKIKWGDTLWDIADTYYKNPWRYKKIAKYNNIKNPDYIISGTIITIPSE